MYRLAYIVQNHSTMKVLRMDQQILKMLGIISSKDKPYYFKMIVSQYTCMITPVLLLLPLIAYFLVNFGDVAEATSASYLICIAGMGSGTYLEFWKKRSIVLSIIQRIQNICDDSSEKFKPFFIKTEALACKIVNYFKIFVFISVFAVVSVPLSVLIFLWITNDYTDEMRMLPASLL